MTDFHDGDIIITGHFAVRVTRTGRGVRFVKFVSRVGFGVYAGAGP